jgi:hypothetical protein
MGKGINTTTPLSYEQFLYVDIIPPDELAFPYLAMQKDTRQCR